MEKLIHHIIVMWDESEHVSPKRSKELSNKFFRAYLSEFPEGIETEESPMVIATRSPMFSQKKLTKFLHKGEFIPYEKENKVLAIVKYCSTGIVDQVDRFRFILDDLRTKRHDNGDPPLLADSACIVVFITNDWAKGMDKAIRTIYEENLELRTNIANIKVEKRGNDRMEVAGILLGRELKKRFLKVVNKALLLDWEKTYS